ncbi:MAG: hypothetical protein H7836_11010 [Magnetococcus sp. YQC-3]
MDLASDNHEAWTLPLPNNRYRIRNWPKYNAALVNRGRLTICFTGRPVYAGCLVQNIGCKAGEKFLELANQEIFLRLGEAMGDLEPDACL